MIEMSGLTKRYDSAARPAVDGLNLTIRRGELLALLGPSGCGKTTTLKMINRLIEPTAGKVHLDGEDHRKLDAVRLRRRIGYVFQGIGLFPHMTVAENIAVVPRLLRWSRAQIAERVNELLTLVELDPVTYQHRFPAALSGGQQQRVGVARALAGRPGVMLMDEPFGALDPITRDALQQQYRQLHASLGLTSVLVTHDMTEALLMADRIAVMDQGRLLQVGTPHELMVSPAAEQVRQLIAMPKRQADKLEALARGEATT